MLKIHKFQLCFYEHEGYTKCVYGFMIWNCLNLYLLYVLYILLFILSVTSYYYELMLLYMWTDVK